MRSQSSKVWVHEKRSCWANSTLAPRFFALASAVCIAFAETSQALSSALVARARLMAIQPEPVPTSNTLEPAFIKGIIFKTNSSVSGLGIKVVGFKAKSRSRKKPAPMTYCKGSPLASRYNRESQSTKASTAFPILTSTADKSKPISKHR